MSDGITLNPGASGPVLYTEDDGAGKQLGATKIIVGAHGVNGGAVTPTNPFPVQVVDAGGHSTPTLDAVSRAGFFKLTDGTNTAPTLDVAARAGFVQVTNGTQTMPTMDAAARPGFVKVTDGTNTQPAMDAAARPGFVKVTDGTNTLPTMDAVGRAGFAKITDGTRTAGVGVGTELYSSGGGSATGTVASAAANTVIKASPGRLCTVLVTAAGSGTGNVLIYDNATTGSGTVIGVVPATIAIGTTYLFNLPAAAGITVQNVASGPALTVSFY